MNKDRKKDKKVRLKKNHFKRAGVCEVLDPYGNRMYLITKDNRIIHRGQDITKFLSRELGIKHEGTLDDPLPRPNVEAHAVEF